MLAARSAAAAVAFPDPMGRPATQVKAASRTVLLGLAQAGSRLVACGERGIIVFSDDAGVTWRQASVPVSVTLTAMSFPNERRGWAVGHDGVVLRSDDRGQTWRRQPSAAASKGGGRALLDVEFQDALSGTIVGAFGLLWTTVDGGEHWLEESARVDNPKGLHLYASRRQGKAHYIAGEQGFLARSADAGATFDRIGTPFGGTFFALAVDGDATVFVGGIRGVVLRSRDHAQSFERIVGPTPVSITSLRPMPNGALLAVNQAGDLMTLSAGSSAMTTLAASGASLSAALPMPDGSFAAVGFFGATRITPNQPGQPGRGAVK